MHPGPIIFALDMCLTTYYLSTLEAQDTDGLSELYLVQKIYIAEMGTTDEAARFRLLLEDQLVRASFTVVDRVEKADAVMSGIYSLRSHRGTHVETVTIRLEDSAGKRVWDTNIQPRTGFNSRTTDYAKYRARVIAERLYRDWKKSTKAAKRRLEAETH